MPDDKASRTRIFVTSLRRNEIEKIEIEATAFQASEIINAAVADEKEFVHFQLASGGAMGIKVSRIVHVSEAPLDSNE
jgi:hypothetical protein